MDGSKSSTLLITCRMIWKVIYTEHHRHYLQSEGSCFAEFEPQALWERD